MSCYEVTGALYLVFILLSGYTTPAVSPGSKPPRDRPLINKSLTRSAGPVGRTHAYPAPSLFAPQITTIAPAQLIPGATATIQGSGFSPAPANNRVTVDGVSVKVVTAKETELVVSLPVYGFACTLPRSVRVSVTTGGASAVREHLLAPARPLNLAKGEVVTPKELELAPCVELSQTGGRYVLTVVNADRSGGSAGFRLRGSAGRAMGPAVPEAPRPFTPLDDSAGESAMLKAAKAGRALARTKFERGDRARHLQLLEANRLRVKRRGSPLRRGNRLLLRPLAERAVPKAGDVVGFRVWKTWGDCDSFDTINARAVYVGPRAIVFEDAASPLAKKMDAQLTSLATEFESAMLGTLAANFGNALAMDSKLDNDGRVRMLFTPRVRQLSSSTLAFVTTCDFYPTTDYASSNVGEVFYATVPEKEEDRAHWYRQNRATIIHEVKHIVSYAEHLSRENALENSWLEEGSAMIAEELYARSFSGAALKSNADYATGLHCDFRPDEAPCAARPYVLAAHFNSLYRHYVATETKSPIMMDYTTTYGSAWSFIRWTIDQRAASESGFLSALTQGAETGTRNLEARAGQPFEELVVGWQLANVLDDYPDFTPARPEFSLLSWNTRDVFSGLYKDPKSPAYNEEFPLKVRPVKFGAFPPESIPNLASGGGAFFELSGSQSATQLLEVQTTAGNPLPATTTLRLSVARVQ